MVVFDLYLVSVDIPEKDHSSGSSSPPSSTKLPEVLAVPRCLHRPLAESRQLGPERYIASKTKLQTFRLMLATLLCVLHGQLVR